MEGAFQDPGNRVFLPSPRLFLFSFKFVYLFLRERERERECASRGGAERQGDRGSEAVSVLTAEIMT